MDNFKKALATILEVEGGYVNHPDDKGSATNKGILQTTYDSYRLSKQQPKKAVKSITDVEVSDIYYSRYWLPSCCNLMPSKLALVVFDTSVNQGNSKVVQYFQELLGSKATLMNAKMINDISYYLSKHSEDDLVLALLERRKLSYIAYAKKGNQRVFLQGWLNRLEHIKGAL